MPHTKELLEKIKNHLVDDYPEEYFQYVFEKAIPKYKIFPDVSVWSGGKCAAVAEIGYTNPQKLAKYQELGIKDVRWYDKDGTLQQSTFRKSKTELHRKLTKVFGSSYEARLEDGPFPLVYTVTEDDAKRAQPENPTLCTMANCHLRTHEGKSVWLKKRCYIEMIDPETGVWKIYKYHYRNRPIAKNIKMLDSESKSKTGSFILTPPRSNQTMEAERYIRKNRYSVPKTAKRKLLRSGREKFTIRGHGISWQPSVVSSDKD